VEEAGRFASVSNNGSLVFLGGNFPPRKLAIIDRQGRELKSHALDDSIIGLPSLSPDASQMVVSSSGDLWIHDLTTGARRRFTFSPAMEKSPTWSPSGRLIAFDSDENLVVKPVDGGPDRTIVRTNFRSGTNVRWSPDSSRLVYLMFPEGSGNRDIWQAHLDQSSPPSPLLATPATELNPDVSPDGRYLAYNSDETGTAEIYVKPFPSGEGKWIVSSSSGHSPKWNPKGGELLYIESRTLMSAKVEVSPSFRVLRIDKVVDLPANGYEILPGGEQLAVVKREETEVGSIVIIDNWLANFQRKP
jgi:Tol biopolymer transport system component